MAILVRPFEETYIYLYYYSRYITWGQAWQGDSQPPLINLPSDESVASVKAEGRQQ